MSNVKVAPIRIDASEAVRQLSELIDLFKFETRSFECVTQHGIELFCNNILALLNCVVLCDFPATIGARCPDEIVLKIKIIGSLDEFTAAIRAGEFHLD